MKIASLLSLLLSSSAFANNALNDLQNQTLSQIDAIKNSPIVGMVAYSAGAIVIFIGLIIVIFLLIMLLKR
jgi:cytochrome bd-type quinol oxidase subunit 1